MSIYAVVQLPASHFMEFQMIRLSIILIFALAACSTGPAPAQSAKPFVATPVATFDAPWAMAFLPGRGVPMTSAALITEKSGKLWLVETTSGKRTAVTGVPAVDDGGQGGFGDVIAHPDFAGNGVIYLSWVEAGDRDTRGAVVGRGKLVMEGATARIDGLQVIWRQEAKVTGRGHFGHRLAFGPDGMLYISSGDRQKFTPAQDMNSNLGKIIRLTEMGMVPSDNPFYDQGRVKSQIWSFGHRNPLGIAFDAQGRLWNQEMGPQGGDELNIVVKAKNYGYPIVSNGNHYDGRDIPDHATLPEFEAPKVSWNPVISPAGLIVYSGTMFPAWRGNIFIGGLSSQALVRVSVNGDTAKEAERYDMGARIREVEQGPDGAIWLLEDEGRLLKLTPKA
jgi:aldose sugar dehydrogenase